MKRLRKLYNNKIELCMLLILGMQIATLVVLNVTRLQYFMDFDSSPTIVQTMKMWEEKELFLKDWYYTTTLVLDSSLPLAVLFYGIVKNVFVAFGLANNVVIILFVYIFSRICNDIKLSKGAQYITMIFLFTPYTIGQLEYLNMMFASQASYNIRALLPMIMISIMIRFYQGKKFREQWAISGLFLVLLFVSGISSSIYGLISCVLPILVYAIIEMLNNDKLNVKILKTTPTYFIILSFIVATCGFMISQRLELTTVVGEETLVRAADFESNMFNCILGIFALLGGLSDGKQVPVLSIKGIFMLLRFAIVVLLLFSLIYMIVKEYKGKDKYIKSYIGMATAVFAVNLGILMLADTSYGNNFEHRYLLVLILPLFVCFGYLYDRVIAEYNRSVRRTFVLGILVGLCMCNIYQFKVAYKVDNHYDELQELTDVINEQDAGLVNVIVSSNIDITENELDGRIMQSAMDVDKMIISDGGIMNDWGQSSANLDNTYYSGKTLILTQGVIFDSLPEYLTKNTNMIRIFDYHEYQLYVADENKFDLVAGFPQNNNTRSIDFPYTTGYNVGMGYINFEGELETSGIAGTVLDGDILGVEGTYNVDLRCNFEPQNSGSVEFVIETESERYYKNFSTNDGNEDIIIELSDIVVTDDEEVHISVNVLDGMKLNVKAIEFVRK